MFDLLVIGGGINGAGIARDAAGRGLKVMLCEKSDLACSTSSASSKLIHGGLRYLEHYELKLVSKALQEREVLINMAPHIIWPMQFVIPHDSSLRPAWLIRIGLFLYDYLDFGKRKRLPGSKGIKFKQHVSGKALHERFKKGFVYSDAWVQDSRLVVLNAIDAAERGAQIRTRTQFVSARCEQGKWLAQLKSESDGDLIEVEARCLVNATGPWVSSLLDKALKRDSGHNILHVKGSHIIVPKLFDHDYAYVFQNNDKRIVFAIPYEGEYTLIGTTEVIYQGELNEIKISDDEIDYLCAACNRYFRNEIKPEDVIWSYSGVRPLFDDEKDNISSVTRDYTLELHTDDAPLLNIFGGKLTTYRKLAEEALEILKPVLKFSSPAWTGENIPLPGGDIEDADFEKFLNKLTQEKPWLPSDLAYRYARNYGTRTKVILGDANGPDDLGEHLGDGIYAAELKYLTEHEWARTAEDILWRRSKLGLHITQETRQHLENWLKREM